MSVCLGSVGLQASRAGYGTVIPGGSDHRSDWRQVPRVVLRFADRDRARHERDRFRHGRVRLGVHGAIRVILGIELRAVDPVGESRGVYRGSAGIGDCGAVCVPRSDSWPVVSYVVPATHSQVSRMPSSALSALKISSKSPCSFRSIREISKTSGGLAEQKPLSYLMPPLFVSKYRA